MTLPRNAVKICGLRDPEHAAAAAEAGADLLGFVFAPTRRRIDVSTARKCIDAARLAAGDRDVIAVGVFVNATAEEVNDTAAIAGLDVLQLHGDVEPALLTRLRRSFIRSLNPEPGQSTSDVEGKIAALRAAGSSPVAYLIDGYSPGEYGGAGVKTDWSLARTLAQRWPIMLAGGLNPDNVEEAILTVSPMGVDVSSGVETDGVKDIAKIEAFVRRARSAFAATIV